MFESDIFSVYTLSNILDDLSKEKVTHRMNRISNLMRHLIKFNSYHDKPQIQSCKCSTLQKGLFYLIWVICHIKFLEVNQIYTLVVFIALCISFSSDLLSTSLSQHR